LHVEVKGQSRSRKTLLYRLWLTKYDAAAAPQFTVNSHDILDSWFGSGTITGTGTNELTEK
jgi:hypothetical protein